MSPQNKIWALWILALLVTLKFLVVPLLEWQDEKASSMVLLEQKISKGKSLLENQELLNERLGKLTVIERQLKERVITFDRSETAFQLKIQKIVDDLIQKNNLKVRNSNWLSPFKSGFAAQHRIELSLSGSVKQFAEFIIDIERQTPRIAIVKASSTVSKMKPAAQKLGTFNGKIVLASWQGIGQG